jgi:regulator of protease activity HflC (stomatin/prohibitin superfamily)
MKTKEENFTGLKLPGIPMLLGNILLPGLIVYLIVVISGSDLSNTLKGVFITLSSILFILSCIFWFGFMLIKPNQARVMVFFGKYRGTVKENGFFWVNPFYSADKLTLRARNMDAEPIKVNDKNGNPILIGQVIVWKVVDTYKASFEVDNTSKTSSIGNEVSIGTSVNDKMRAYEHFVRVQGYAALRFVAGQYAYDNSLNEDEKMTLRAGGENINEILVTKLNERLALAGIEVLEARINHLAYAPEIAAVMLRRQQAEAIIAAREKIVEGAVGMVKQALDKLEKEGVVDLDGDKKAAMVSNLLVVLCSDENAQPIINSGTLYN